MSLHGTKESRHRYYSPTYHVWHGFEKQLPHFTLRGHSVSARQSGFYIPQWRVCLDAGIPLDSEPLFVCLTHGHSDHAGALTSILTGNNQPVTVLLPPSIRQLVANEIVAKQRVTRENLSLTESDVLPSRCTLVDAVPGLSLQITETIRVEVFETHHKVSSCGFAFFKSKRCLRAEYKGSDKEQLVAARNAGIDTSEVVEEPVFAYVGDSTPNWFLHNKEFFQSFKTIMCECTFVGELEGDGGVERAKTAADEHGHTCWSDLKSIIHDNPEVQFILCHWSERYTKDGPKLLTDFFEKGSLPNLYPWLW